jgi:acyl-CoA synthetase (AMP-forming)/AMP-acid ligase II
MRKHVMGLTQGLWNEDERYIQNYWSTWPGIWHHGDFASRDEDGHWYIWGRSDDTLKIAGKRTGPSEIEALLMATGKLAEAAAIGVPDPIKGSTLVLVCVAKPGSEVQPMSRARTGHTVPPRQCSSCRPPKTRSESCGAIRTHLGENAGDVSSPSTPGLIEEIARGASSRAQSTAARVVDQVHVLEVGEHLQHRSGCAPAEGFVRARVSLHSRRKTRVSIPIGSVTSTGIRTELVRRRLRPKFGDVLGAQSQRQLSAPRVRPIARLARSGYRKRRSPLRRARIHPTLPRARTAPGSSPANR